MANHLAGETSPYLLQHKDNPVNWYPWGEEALGLARRENKPILLSIGYSACHWCHVMEEESFIDLAIAELMNEHFVNIKVDREERPDLDQIYQNVAIAMNQGGGWPLTVFLTPDLKPFFGGTYFPPTDKYGRPGFPRVLQALSNAYKNDHAVVVENANRLAEFIVDSGKLSSPDQKSPDSANLDSIVQELLMQIDGVNGGFGGAPKFPNSMLLSFLWRYGCLFHLPEARDAVHLSLVRMISGGIYDQIGGGFHRYAVDGAWSIPHFEKMLYDNALLLGLIAEVLLYSGLENGNSHGVQPSKEQSHRVFPSAQERELYLQALEDTAVYVMREMTVVGNQGFYSAQDADSEGEEGKFFVWTRRDFQDLVASGELTELEAQVFQIRYGMSELGNFEEGKTVLSLAKSLAETAQLCHLSESQVQAELECARAKLLKVRDLRVRPRVDDKVLTGWNGLMVSGMAWAAQALRKNGRTEIAHRIEDTARDVYDFIVKNCVSSEGRLSSSFQGGKAKGNGFLDDYAFMARAAIDLSRFANQSQKSQKYLPEKYLKDAQNWLNALLDHFQDSGSGGYFFTSDDHEALIHRPKSIFDQAIPSGSSVALECMQALIALDFQGCRDRYEAEVEKQIASLFVLTTKNPYGVGELLCANLMKAIGPVTVQGEHAAQVCIHPYVFQQPLESDLKGKWLVCHQRSCSLPLESLDDAIRLTSETLRF